MSYYRPSFHQTAAMSRGRGYSSRGSYRGGSNRGNNWEGGRGGGGYSSRGRGGGGNRFDSNFTSSFESRSKYGSSGERYAGSRSHEEYHRKPYRMESNYSSGRENTTHHRSPDRKRPRNEAPSSRHDSYGGGYGSSNNRYESSYSDRRSFSNDRHPAPFSRRDEFRKPTGPPRGGGYRGRISTRGSRGLRLRDRPPRRRLLDSSYSVRKRVIPARTTDYARKLKISKMRSAIAARGKQTSDKEESDEEAEEDKEVEDEEVPDAVLDKTDVTMASPSKDKQDAPEDKDNPDEPSKKMSLIKLNCPHCGVQAITFRRYELHFQSRAHMTAMRKISIKQKAILAQMRLAQRNAQNELERNSNDLVQRTNFCPLCKLNYKQRKIVHQESEAHKNMKKFLMPYCKLCSMTFKSPMMYESHCCNIEHMKRQQRVDNGENSDVGDDENNLEHFTTIDSVGVDGEGSDDEEKPDVKEPVSVGIEQIRKIEAYYCDLCKMYVSKGLEEGMQSILARHCKLRTHMQRYIRFTEDKELEKRAEKLQRKETAQKEDKVKLEQESIIESPSPLKADIEIKSEKEANKTIDDEEARDDKLWADVDKDLDDILAKEGNKSSDEDEEEDLNGERYDRFKYSEKNGDEKEGKADGKEAAEVPKATTEPPPAK